MATDNAGASTTSSPVSITVSGPNAPPTVSLTNPANGAVFYLPANITLSATASDDGSIAKVEFFQGATLIGTVSAPPYTLNWAAPAGTHSLTAAATDNLGAVTVSSPVSITVKDSITYLHNDIAGNPIAATGSDGAVLWKENFRPFGERLNNPPAAANNRQWFHRKAHDADTGLAYFGARYYDPLLGRFMGVDAEGVKDDNLHSFNRYAYGNNNPFRYIDPDGRYAEDLALGIPSLAIGAKSFVDNVRAGNWGSATVDVAGMMADAAAIALPGVPGGIGLGIKATREGVEDAARGVSPATETVQRAMSRAEFKATQETGLLRGGREGTHYVSDAVNSNANRARERLALPQKPEVRVTFEVPKGTFSPSSKVKPAFRMPGGGTERTAVGKIKIKIKHVDEM